MLYLLFYEVGPGYLERRQVYREGHLALARAAQDRGDLVMAGTLAEPVSGAVLVFRGDSPAAAERFAAEDPYVVSGLVHRWQVRPWVMALGEELVAPVRASA